MTEQEVIDFDLRWTEKFENYLEESEKILSAIPVDMREKYREDLMNKLFNGEPLWKRLKNIGQNGLTG
jgi:hypothetical protein